MLGNLHSLDIINGKDLTGTNALLRENKQKILGRGPYDYIYALRDDMLVARGYKQPPYWQESWKVRDMNKVYWEPSDLDHCRHWFSPEYAHPESSDPNDCVQWEDRMGNYNFEQQSSGAMPQLTADAAARGLDVLDLNGSNHFMEGTDNTMMNVGTEDWACAIAVIGTDDTSDTAALLKKGNKWNLSFDFASGAKDVIFTWNDGTLGALTITGGALHDDDHISIITFGRNAGVPFLWVRKDTTERTAEHGSSATGSLDVSTKPLLGASSSMTIGGAQRVDSRIVELIFIDDTTGSVADVNSNNIAAMEGYLAYKYLCASDILPTDHRFYSGPETI